MTDSKTEIPGVYKTPEGFLINKDNNALAAYKTSRNKMREMQNLHEEVKSLRDDMSEIKELLKGLVK